MKTPNITVAVWLCSLACTSTDVGHDRGERPPASTAAHVAAAGPAPAAAETDLDDEEPDVVVDGKYLYTRNCAGCHNDNGDGAGPTILQMGMKARSFAEGHFAFGNTRDAIYRTIASGVPGRSPMPGYAGVLSEEERWMVVDYVRTLMPAEEQVDESASILRAEDRPLLVRGHLPPIVEGAPAWPRGLLIGTPEGLTFEYRIDDVRLVGVRQGELADRRDWYDRGGSTLKPLGQPIYLVDCGDPQRALTIEGPGTGGWQPHRAQLAKTWVRDGQAHLAYAFRSPDGDLLGEMQETPSGLALSSGPAYRRDLKWRSSKAARVPLGNTGSAGSVTILRSEEGGEGIQLLRQPLEDVTESTVVLVPSGCKVVDAGGDFVLELAPNVDVTLITLSTSSSLDDAQVLAAAGVVP